MTIVSVADKQLIGNDAFQKYYEGRYKSNCIIVIHSTLKVIYPEKVIEVMLNAQMHALR